MKINKFNKVLALSTLALFSTLGAQSFTINNPYPTQYLPGFKVINTTGSVSPDNFASYDDGNGATVVWNQSSGERIDDLNVDDYPYMAMAVRNRSIGNYYSISINPSTQDTYNAETSTISISGLSVLVVKVDDFKNWTYGLQAEPTTFLVDDQTFDETQDDSVIVSFFTDSLINGGTQTIYTNIDNPISYVTLQSEVSAKDLFGANVTIDWPDDSVYDPNTLGTYNIPISATDSYGQTATATVIVVVEDITAPTIALASGASLSYNTSTNATLDFDTLANKFTISDNASDNGGSIGTPTFKLDGTSLTADKTFGASDVGSHTLTVSVADSSGNSTSQDFTLAVADTIAPVIAFKDGSALDTKITAGVSNTFDSNFASSAIVSLLKATDDVDGDVSTSLSVSFPDGFNNVGDHIITVSAKDSAGNLATQTFTLEVSQDVPPVFIFDESLILTTADSPLSASDLTATIAQSYKSTYSTINSIVLDDEDVANYTENANKVGDYPIAFTINALNANGSVEEVNRQMTVRVLATTTTSWWDKVVSFHEANPWMYAIEAVAGLAIIALIIDLVAKKKR